MSLRVHGDAFVAPDTLDFAVNVWPAPRQPQLEEALAAALRDPGYPDERSAREAVAALHGRRVGEVLLTNGACEAFWLLAHALRPARAACVHPSFTEPEAALRAVGAEVVRVFRAPPTWEVDPQAVPADADAVVLGNPNNPTGSLDGPERLAALASPGRLLVVDEAFMGFVPDESASLASRRELPGLVVVRSLTKLWSLAGVRAGYLLADETLVERLAAHQQPWSVNSLACAAIAVCAADTQTPPAVARAVESARTELLAGLARLPGVEAWPSAANFVLLRVPDGEQLAARLREDGIAVRPAASFPGLDDSYVRVAVRPAADAQRLLAALERAL